MMGARNGITLVLVAGAGAIALGLAVSPSCSQTPPARSPLAPSAHKSDPAPDPSSPDLPEAKKHATTYADAMRRRQFERAARLIDQATEAEQNAPEVRYARALAALKLGDIETALRLSDKLEKSSPLFEREARALRLDAAKSSDDVTLLVHLLGGSKSPADQLLVAEAHEKGSSILEARKIADSVLHELSTYKRNDGLELSARARMIRARTLLAEDKKTEAAREYHWLATKAAALDEDGEFDARVSELDPERALNSKERLARIEAFSENGLVKRTEAEIEALRKISPVAGSPQNTDHHLAWAVFTSRSDYERAAQLFAKAAAHGGPDRAKHLYYEAKSLARSHRDQEAILKYEGVTALGGSYADHAAYQAAHLRFIDGQWQAAVAAYLAYLKKYGSRATHRTSAERELPIARLAAGDFSRAESELTALLKAESDQRERARLMELVAVALLGEKKEAEAEAMFRRVIDYRPLSLPALLAAARLREMKKPASPLIAPASLPSAGDKPDPPLKLSLPEKVWRLSRVGLDEQAEEALLSEESHIRSQLGPRSGEALCRLYGQLESARRRYQIAQTAASWSVLSQAPRSSTEWQWDCIYPTPYEKIVREEANRNQLPPAFVYAVMRQESAFRPTVVSPAKAVGLMQIIPPTAERIAQALQTEVSPELMRAPAVNITFGTYYLRYLLDIFSDRLELAAASYNAGPHAVTRWLRAGDKLPLDIFIARIPYKETRNYVYRVMGNYARYAYRDDEQALPQIDLAIPSGLKAPQDAY